VVVIGGGVIGASIAYHLVKRGWRDVVLLERRQLTSGTTWHAAGLITSAGMAHETLLWMSRYTRELCISLEGETGQATGWRPIGHLHVATTPQRLEGLRREAAFARAHGVDNQEISASEFGKLWPAARTDDVLAAFYVADEGRVNPADLTMAYARGARAGGARIFEHLPATAVLTERGRVTGVVTDRGTIRTEVVVNATGMWARELGAQNGVAVPLQAAEHYYLITDTVDWAHPDLPIVEEPDRYGYYREEGGGILVGLFEPKAAPWSLDRVPEEIAFASLPPDWDRIGPFLTRAMDRFPSLHDARVRTMFCGPESFTADNMPHLGESPEVRGYFVAAGMNSLGIILSGGVGSLMTSWIVDGAPHEDVTGMAVDRTQVHETTRRFRAERTVELLGDLFGDVAFPNAHPHTARNIRRSAIHDRLADAGAHFAASSLWEYAEWFAPPGEAVRVTPTWGRDASFPLQAAEHHAVREDVGMLDMSLMAKFLVQGRDAERVLNLVSVADVSVPVGRIVYTPWCNAAGGIEADLTVTRLAEDRFLVVVTDLVHRRIAPWIERHTPEGAHVSVTDVTSGTALLTVQGPRSRQLLSRLTTADLSNAAFPYLTAHEIDIAYARVLALRVTYVGELGWELHVPAELAVTVYDALLEAGSDLGYRNVGLGAMGSLRLEKAYRDYGIDIDNSDTPLDVGLGFAVAWDKPGGFVGRDALLAARSVQPPVRRMVQVLVGDAEPLLYGGEPVLLHGRVVGTVRAGAYGHTLGGAVGLAMLEDPAGLPAEAVEHDHFEVDIAGVRYPARGSVRPMYDPDRHRIRA
jgi:4-methylaminobutanoate oxidase (formaldehyde-forming)